MLSGAREVITRGMALLTGGVCDGGMEGWEVTQVFLPFSLFVPLTSRPTVRQLLHQRRFVCRRHVDPTESIQSVSQQHGLLLVVERWF